MYLAGMSGLSAAGSQSAHGMALSSMGLPGLHGHAARDTSALQSSGITAESLAKLVHVHIICVAQMKTACHQFVVLSDVVRRFFYVSQR